MPSAAPISSCVYPSTSCIRKTVRYFSLSESIAALSLTLRSGSASRVNVPIDDAASVRVQDACVRDVASGLVRMEMPGRQGVYDPWRVALAMIGAVGGSLMNLVYPYFLEAKGWRGPHYRRLQLYDFILGMVAMLVLNLAVWVLGAELLSPDRHIEHL